MTDNRTIRGRDRIAEALGRDVKTISRWVAKGVLPVQRRGPFSNSQLECRVADLVEIKEKFGGREGE
jgi:hypothetical protein